MGGVDPWYFKDMVLRRTILRPGEDPDDAAHGLYFLALRRAQLRAIEVDEGLAEIIGWLICILPNWPKSGQYERYLAGARRALFQGAATDPRARAHIEAFFSSEFLGLPDAQLRQILARPDVFVETPPAAREPIRVFDKIPPGVEEPPRGGLAYL